MSHAGCFQAFGRDFYIEPASALYANAVFQDEYQIRELRKHDVRTIVDVGAHVGSFTVLCHEWWPEAKIVAVEPHPESFELLERNTAHIPETLLLRINAAIAAENGHCLLASAVSNSRVGEYVVELWNDLDPRYGDFGVRVPAITTEELWQRLVEFGIDDVHLLKLDCEGAEYPLLEHLLDTGVAKRVDLLLIEWHAHRMTDPLLPDRQADIISRWPGPIEEWS